MAKQRQQMYRKVDLEELVDMFIENRLEFGDGSISRDKPGIAKNAKDDIFGDLDHDGTPCRQQAGTGRQEYDAEVAIRSLGKSLSRAGDELWARHTGSVSKHDLVEEIINAGQLSKDGKMPEDQEEEHWKHFKEMLDKAVEDIGPNNPCRMMIAVLTTIKGLTYFGRGVAILARRFTLRYFEEHRLKKDIERAGGIDKLFDENLD